MQIDKVDKTLSERLLDRKINKQIRKKNEENKYSLFEDKEYIEKRLESIPGEKKEYLKEKKQILMGILKLDKKNYNMPYEVGKIIADLKKDDKSVILGHWQNASLSYNDYNPSKTIVIDTINQGIHISEAVGQGCKVDLEKTPRITGNLFEVDGLGGRIDVIKSYQRTDSDVTYILRFPKKDANGNDIFTNTPYGIDFTSKEMVEKICYKTNNGYYIKPEFIQYIITLNENRNFDKIYTPNQIVEMTEKNTR